MSIQQKGSKGLTNGSRVFSFKNLGVNFSANLEFSDHVNFIVKKANSMLGFIKRFAKEFNDPYVTLSLYNCYVRPHLEYASQEWTPFYEIHKKRIQSVQHNFIRFALKGLPRADPYNLPPYEQIRMTIHITVSGYAKVRWIKKGYPRDSERAACRAYKSYLSSRSYVLGSCSNSSIIDWLAGEYTYTFHVILPTNLPTSFDGKYGQIHYEIVTTIDRPGRYPKVYKLPFTVIHPIDLNSDPIYRVPLEILDRKRFWSFCCPTGPLTVKYSTPYCGYAPGQKINFVLYINNESSIDITECDVKLKQEVRYESHNPQHEYRLDKNLIARKKYGNVLRWSRKVYRGSLEILSIPPSSSKFPCPIVVTYFIKIIIKPTDFHWKIKLKIPLTIGSMPIMDQTLSRNQTNEEIIQQQQQTPALIVTDSDNPPEYVPMVPPSYEDAMALSERFFDDTEYLHNVSMTNITTNNGESFKPRYPVYYDFMTPFIPPGSEESSDILYFS